MSFILVLIPQIVASININSLFHGLWRTESFPYQEDINSTLYQKNVFYALNIYFEDDQDFCVQRASVLNDFEMPKDLIDQIKGLPCFIFQSTIYLDEEGKSLKIDDVKETFVLWDAFTQLLTYIDVNDKYAEATQFTVSFGTDSTREYKLDYKWHYYKDNLESAFTLFSYDQYMDPQGLLVRKHDNQIDTIMVKGPHYIMAEVGRYAVYFSSFIDPRYAKRIKVFSFKRMGSISF